MPARLTCTALVEVESAVVPDSYGLGDASPNPFNPEIWSPFEFRQDAEVPITIYGVRGKRLRQLQLGIV